MARRLLLEDLGVHMRVHDSATAADATASFATPALVAATAACQGAVQPHVRRQRDVGGCRRSAPPPGGPFLPPAQHRPPSVVPPPAASRHGPICSHADSNLAGAPWRRWHLRGLLANRSRKPGQCSVGRGEDLFGRGCCHGERLDLDGRSHLSRRRVCNLPVRVQRGRAGEAAAVRARVPRGLYRQVAFEGEGNHASLVPTVQSRPVSVLRTARARRAHVVVDGSGRRPAWASPRAKAASSTSRAPPAPMMNSFFSNVSSVS